MLFFPSLSSFRLPEQASHILLPGFLSVSFRFSEGNESRTSISFEACESVIVDTLSGEVFTIYSCAWFLPKLADFTRFGELLT